MITYKFLPLPVGETEHKSIMRSDGWSIPFDLDNTDYQAYLKWVAEGNTPEAAE